MNQKHDETDINLGRLISYYLRHWMALLGSGIAVALLAFLVTEFIITPKYQANVTVYVNNTKSAQSMESITGTNLTAAQQLVNTYVNIIQSDTVLDEVLKQGKLEGRAEDIREIMTARQVENTEMFTVSILHPDAEMAAKIANTIAAVAPGKISGFVRGSSTEIIDYAKVPNEPYSPSPIKNTVLGALVGCFLMAVCLTFRYLFDMRIRDEEELALYFDLPVLGVIPECDQNRDGGYETWNESGKGGRKG